MDTAVNFLKCQKKSFTFRAVKGRRFFKTRLRGFNTGIRAFSGRSRYFHDLTSRLCQKMAHRVPSARHVNGGADHRRVDPRGVTASRR